MCLAVYVAADAQLPEIEWKEHAPAFYLEAVAPSEVVRTQFRHEHVYYAGSHEGCGCGFNKDGKPPEEFELCQQDYRSLAAVLSQALLDGATLQLFTCWEGEQAAAPEASGVVTVQRLAEPDFELQQLSLLEVRLDA